MVTRACIKADVKTSSEVYGKRPHKHKQHLIRVFFDRKVHLVAPDAQRYVEYPIEDVSCIERYIASLAEIEHDHPGSWFTMDGGIDVIEHHCMPAFTGLSIHILPFILSVHQIPLNGPEYCVLYHCTYWPHLIEATLITH